MNVEVEQVRRLRNAINGCYACLDLNEQGDLSVGEKEIGLSYLYPSRVPIRIFFIAQAPPKPGHGFFYDKTSRNPRFREKLFKLLNEAGLGPLENLADFNAQGYYLSDAVYCRWGGKFIPKRIMTNCSVHLARFIQLFKPKFIAAMGNVAKGSLKLENVHDAIRSLNNPPGSVVEMSMIVTASSETDSDRVKKLRSIAQKLMSLNCSI
jgi:uracil-DNA glycosylase